MQQDWYLSTQVYFQSPLNNAEELADANLWHGDSTMAFSNAAAVHHIVQTSHKGPEQGITEVQLIVRLFIWEKWKRWKCRRHRSGDLQELQQVLAGVTDRK